MSQSPNSSLLSGLPESVQFLRLIWALSFGLDRTSTQMAAHIGVTGRQRFVLRLVGLIPAVTREQLGALLPVDPLTIEREVQHLIDDGFLAILPRRTSEGDVLHLTSLGAGVNATRAGTVESAITLALDEATPYERAAFRRMLERVTPHLSATSP